MLPILVFLYDLTKIKLDRLKIEEKQMCYKTFLLLLCKGIMGCPVGALQYIRVRGRNW